MSSKLFATLRKLNPAGKQRSATRIATLTLILTALIAVGLMTSFRSGYAQSGGRAPDYSKVDDFLDGETHLLRNDDLVITFNYRNASPNGRSVLFTAGLNDSSPTYLNYNQQTVPNGQAGCSSSGGCNYDYQQYVGNAPVTGRFFNSVKDTTVHYPVRLDNRNAPLLVALEGKSVDVATGKPAAAGLTWSTAQDISFVTAQRAADTFLSAVGDFNGDGFDDLVMGYSSAPSLPSDGKLRIATAVDVNDPAKGFKFGPEFELDFWPTIRQLAIGDFNGDRLPEIAAPWIDRQARLTVSTFRVDPATLAISNGGSTSLYQLRALELPNVLEITAGKFTGRGNDQLAISFLPLYIEQSFKVQIIDFDLNSVQPKLMTTFDVPDSSTGVYMKMKAGRLDWASPYDQLVWMVTNDRSGTRLQILTVDPGSLAVSTRANYVFDRDPNNYAGRDIAIGNFDRRQPSPSNPATRERNPNLQVAMIGPIGNRSSGQFGVAGLAILDVSADFSQFTTSSYTVLNQSYFGGNDINSMSLAAGDLRGRSFRLGTGYKVTVDRTQPSVVLAMPPMHADYVYPAIGRTPTVLNLSVAPDGFKSEYEQTESRDAKATDTQTTSSSFSGEESIGGSITIGKTDVFTGELENGVKITDTFKAKQDKQDSSENLNGAFNSSEYEVSQETGLSDVVWFKDTSYFLYVYPVIGRKVCPADKADRSGNCAESDKVPMQLMFSAPKQTTIHRLASDTLEWYQPPWEPGNILSYPAGLAQLKQYIPDIELLTTEQTVFATDDAGATFRTTWANGKTTGQTVEHELLFSEENDLSIEGATSVKPFGIGASVTASTELNFGGSNGTKSLSESETELKSARGITVTKSAAFADPLNYKYFFSPYIFGKQKPIGFADPVDTTADLLAYGTLRSAFTVDPLGSTANRAGSWWSQSPYWQLPDVAVNHPNRWAYGREPRSPNSPVPANCVDLDGLTMNCITPTEREPENPWTDSFHDMRGLFITDARNKVDNSNPFVAGGGGAQLETATDGAKLTLSTRVYNYSFRAMPTGSKVKVRFYGMELNEQNIPINGDGGSFLIGEDVLNPIAPFNNDPSAPLNWVLAKTIFDTTGRQDQALAFWVAVWIEDANGRQVQEVTGHGLTGIPESKDKPSFEEITKLEEMVSNPLKQSDDDPAQVSFSNNIGFYRSVFHILPKATAATAPANLNGDPGTEAAEIKIEKVETAGTRLKPGQSVEASVTLRNGAQELLGVTVYFYDGAPGAGGRLFDIERIARLRANAQQRVSIRFRPQLCGAHQIFVRVDPGEQHTASGQAAQSVQVECPTPVCVAQVCLRSPQYYALNLRHLPHGTVTITGGGLNNQVSTGDTKRLSLLLQGGVSRQQQLNRQFVATQLSLLAHASGTQTALQSNLLCYRANFQPVQLSNGQTLNPSMTLGELFAQVRQAGQAGNAIDQRLLTNLLALLNGNDPLGRCQ